MLRFKFEFELTFHQHRSIHGSQCRDITKAGLTHKSASISCADIEVIGMSVPNCRMQYVGGSRSGYTSVMISQNCIGTKTLQWKHFALVMMLVDKRVNQNHPNSKVLGANMGPTWVMSAPDGPPVGPMNLAIRAPMMTHGTLKDFFFWMLSKWYGTIFTWTIPDQTLSVTLD